MSRHIEAIINIIHKEKGNKSEHLVRNAIQCLLDSGEIDSIEGSVGLDVRGIDFLVSRGPKRYKLSVKSSPGGIRHELDEHPERHQHGDILFIVPGRNETREELAKRIIDGINVFEKKMHQK